MASVSGAAAVAAGTLAAMAVSARGRAEDKHQKRVNELRILTKSYCHSRIPRIKYLRLRGDRLLLKEKKVKVSLHKRQQLRDKEGGTNRLGERLRL